ncbi:hypothetical protein [Pseudomonas syringae]|uniref:hypothetical protein n=1 Tax=Pseudomonas syringae TaxID=317 RepID=UPI0002ADC3F3|nr:hypothetical protein [Pseudomonas syringae]ELS43312.1 Prophage PSSB64-03, Orf50 [Pseudomonas syringae pv. syringae B64]
MTIDWSKAPEGATHLTLPNSPNQCPVFWRVAGSKALEAWPVENDFSVVRDHFRYGADGCPSFIDRLAIPKPAPWAGEGLPPVGMVCEFAGFNPDETTFDDPVVGDKITVIAHYLSGCVQVAAFTYNCAANLGSLNVAQGAHGCFRPLRTSEQIEADQKKQEVQELMIVLGSVESAAYKDIAIAIQQANFRKQVSQ